MLYLLLFIFVCHQSEVPVQTLTSLIVNIDISQELYRLFDDDPVAEPSPKSSRSPSHSKTQAPPLPRTTDLDPNGTVTKPPALRPQTLSRYVSCELTPDLCIANTKTRPRSPSPILTSASTTSSEISLPPSVYPSIWTPTRETSEDTEDHDPQKYEVSRILKRRDVAGESGWVTEYLVRWVDTWVNVEDMEGSRELVEEWENTGRNVKKKRRPRKEEEEEEEEETEEEIVERRRRRRKKTEEEIVRKRGRLRKKVVEDDDG